ncbi:MAG: hypothetical protein H6510_01840 [Acidobacteria bacterium]|nr:hypothetical protein [Acidobacteriota bacterium]MCB9396533.1 hypothetical protein [Acidobacteriota bacterium]
MTSAPPDKMKLMIISELETRRKKLSAKFNGLKMNVVDHKLAARTEYEDRMIEIKAKLNTAERKMEEFRNSGHGSWSQVKADIDKALSEIESTIKTLAR